MSSRLLPIVLMLCIIVGCRYIGTSGPPDETVVPPTYEAEVGWFSLFDGTSFDGWTPSERERSFRIFNGMIVADGWRSHLFYTGPVAEHTFTDFHFKADVRTTPGANSGIYFHTKLQGKGWPQHGYEAQVNNTHRDKRKTGSLYAVQDVREQLVQDNTWFTYEIMVRGGTITIAIDGETVVSYTEPEDPSQRTDVDPGRVLSSGTVALQAHDPWSKVYYANLRVKPL